MESEIKPRIFSRSTTLLLMLCITILILVITFLYYDKEKNQAISSIHNELRAISLLKTKQIAEWREDLLTDALMIQANNYFINDYIRYLSKPDDIELQNRIKSFLQSLLLNRNYFDVYLVDSNLDIKIKLDGNTNLGKQTKNLILKTGERGKPILSDLHIAETYQKVHLDLAVPLLSNTTVIGYVIMRVNPEYFLFPQLQFNVDNRQSSEIILFRSEEDSVIYLNRLKFLEAEPLSLKVPLSNIKPQALELTLADTGISTVIDYRGQRVLAYKTKIPDTEWILVVKTDEDEIFKDLSYLSSSILIIGLFLILSSNLLIAFLYRNRQKQILQKMLIQEKQLLQTQLEFKTILYSIGDAVIVTDTQGIIRSMNKIAEELCGIKEKEAIGLEINDVFDIYNEETHEKVDNPVYRVLKEGIIIGLANHTILKSKEGREIAIADSAAPIMDSNNQITGIVLVFRDQTEEREYLKQIEQSEQKLKSIFRAAPAGILLVRDREIIEVNERLCEMLKYSPEEIIGQNTKFLYPDISEYEYIGKQYAQLDQSPVGIAETKWISKTGEILDIILFASPLKIYESKDTVVVFAVDITERKRLEELTKEQHRKLNTLIDNLPGFVYRCKNDCDWTMEYVSNGIEDITGYPAEDFINNKVRTFNSIIHPDYQEYLWNKWQYILSKKDTFTEEYEIINSKGETRWVWERGCGIFEGDKLVALEGYITDITEKKKAELILEVQYEIASIFKEKKDLHQIFKEVTQVLNKVLDATNFFIAKYDAQNKKFFSIYENDEKDDIPIWDAKGSLSYKVLEENRSIWVTKDQILNLIQRGEVKLIGTLPEVWLGVPLNWNNTCAVIVVQSYTNPSAYDKYSVELMETVANQLGNLIEKSRAEQEFIKLSSAVIQSPNGVILTDKNGIIEFINPSVERITNLKLSEAANKNLYELFSHKNSEKIKSKFEEICKSNEKINFELVEINSLNQETWLDIVISPITDNKGNVEHYAIILRDISIRKKLENDLIKLNKELEQRVKERTLQLTKTLEELKKENDEHRHTRTELEIAKNELEKALEKEKELNMMKTRFISMVSHEYRTPLTVILTSTYIIEKYLKDGTFELAFPQLEKIKNSIDMMTSLIDDVLIVGKSEEELTDINLKTISIKKFISEIIEDIKVYDNNKHPIEMKFEIQNDNFGTDPKLLQQILTNLLINACKYSPNDSPIILETIQRDNDLFISVIDKGIGISSEEQANIFQPFYRKKEFIGTVPGSGLGLSIVKRCLDVLGGEISFSSKENQGTTFTVRLKSLS